MAQKFFNAGPGINFGPQVQPPINPVDGDIYYDVTLGALQFYNKGQWFSFTQAEYDNGTSVLDTVVIDLSKGQLQKINLNPQVAITAITLKLINGIVGNQYKIKVTFDESCNYVTPVRVFAGQNFSGVAQVSARPNSMTVLSCTVTAAGVQYTADLYDNFSYAHLVDALPTSMACGTQPNQATYAYLYGGLPYIFGANNFGQFGDGTAYNGLRKGPRTPLTGRSYSQISVGTSCVIGIEGSTGLAWAWGSGGFGILGSGNNNSASTPVSVLGGRSWKSISASLGCAAIEASTGYLYMWGANSLGSLGNGTILGSNSPVSVIGGRRFSWVVTSYCNTYAIEASTGYLWAWGDNTAGQLGINSGALLSASSPVSVVGGKSYSQVFTGYNTAFALEGSTGCAWAWGGNVDGQLGNNTVTAAVSSPISVFGGRSFSKITCGGAYYSANFETPFAIEGSTGLAWAWGDNSRGQLGINTSSSMSSPVAVFGGRSFSDAVGAPQGIFAVEGATGALYSLGWNYCGNSRLSYSEGSPTAFDPAYHGGKVWSQVAVSEAFSLFIDSSTGYAWAAGYQSPVTAMSTTENLVSIPGGKSFSQVALTHGSGQVAGAVEASTGLAWAWGAGISGALGNSSVANASSPVSVFGGRSYRQLVTGAYSSDAFMLAIEASTGNVYSWGANTRGQLGNNTVIAASAPVAVSLVGSFKQISASIGMPNAYGILANTGIAYGWGDNSFGQVGNGTISVSINSPVAVSGGRSFKQIAASGFMNSGGNVVALEGSTGNAYTWGYGANGQLGNNTIIATSVPVSVFGGRSFNQVVIGADSTVSGDTTVFALEGSTGYIWAWGGNYFGQIGNKSAVTGYSSPVLVSSGKSWKALISNISSGVVGAVDQNNALYFWGRTPPLGAGPFPGTNFIGHSSPVSIARYNYRW